MQTLPNTLIKTTKINMLMVNFKIHLTSEKNSEIIGRMVVNHCSKIIKVLGFMVTKNVVWIDQNVRLIYKVQKFLTTAPCYYPKIFQLTSRFKKQTP